MKMLYYKGYSSMDMSLTWKIGFLPKNRKLHMLKGYVQTDGRYMLAENGKSGRRYGELNER